MEYTCANCPQPSGMYGCGGDREGNWKCPTHPQSYYSETRPGRCQARTDDGKVMCILQVPHLGEHIGREHALGKEVRWGAPVADAEPEREDATSNAVSREPTRFVREKLNPILGRCFNEAVGRVKYVYGAGTDLPETASIDFLRTQTTELISTIAGLVRSMRELKGSRNFPGEDPSPTYDRGIEDCVQTMLAELGVAHE